MRTDRMKDIAGPGARLVTLFAVVAFAAAAAAATPDLTGPWEIKGAGGVLKTAEGKAPPLTAEGRKLYKANQAAMQDDPMKRCLPPGVPRVMLQKGFAFDIVMGPDVGGMFFEWNHLPRPIYLDIAHFENIGPTYFGQTVGKWDGATLVLDTNGFNDTTWIDDSGLPHSDELQVSERLRLLDANTLEDRITIRDPKIFSEPWTTVLTFSRRPGYLIRDDYCLGRLGIVKPRAAAPGK